MSVAPQANKGPHPVRDLMAKVVQEMEEPLADYDLIADNLIAEKFNLKSLACLPASEAKQFGFFLGPFFLMKEMLKE